MKYVLLGKLNPAWIAKSKERTEKAKQKLADLGITLETVLYTQGAYDFMDVVDAKDSSAMLAFSVWYAAQGFGGITTMPAFAPADMDSAVAKL